MIIIALSGKKQSGKDTVADILTELARPTRVFRLAFADALKEELACALGVTVDYINQNKAKFRSLMQAWGDTRRAVNGNDYFVNKLLVKLNDARYNNHCIVVITDLRYMHELIILRSIGAYICRVVRNIDDFGDPHSSEIDLDTFYEWDNIVMNNHTLESLKQEVKELLLPLTRP